MQHPFAGVIVPEPHAECSLHSARQAAPEAAQFGRRSFVTAALGAVGGAFALLWGGKSQAEEPYAGPALPSESPITQAENAGTSAQPHRPSRIAAQPVGQASSQPTPSESQPSPQVTTQALNEEGGGTQPNPSPPDGTGSQNQVTTYALGEEGSGGQPTTYALGEEGSGGWYTTYALGEEGWYPPPRGPVTTFALGEEGAVRRQRRRWRRRR